MLKDYQENGDKNFTEMTDEFWKDSEKRLLITTTTIGKVKRERVACTRRKFKSW